MSKTSKSKVEAPLDFRLNGSRRSFIKYGGATLAASGLLISGCEHLEQILPDKGKGKPEGHPRPVNLGSGDTGILNYAYALEQLEAAFYIEVVNMPYNGIPEEEMVIMEDLRKHEVAHRDFLKAALGDKAIISLSFDFSSVDFSNRQSVLSTAKTFEDLGVAAYNGAGRLFESTDLLLIAGKIVSVEGRHAAAIRSVLDEDSRSFAGSDVIDGDGLDRAFKPEKVLEAASPFILNKINANQLPKS
ncbi:Ferritin-like domain-containing protein [Cyclobacterium lianum]|uniref:Ferritin-like domain-containing protein n=1 Tax=Cyclobacterium lianum TaxID=388280 RepID=A0A1M7MN84_9BACT|nr:ferritin-like domain-containing protein [Cyclobacterium lianum]SHM91936.1 Ferritin-like domain-containing protein [Cyclobacterium lianum]